MKSCFLSILILVPTLSAQPTGEESSARGARMPRIRVSGDGARFVTSSGERFVPWGFNYDHDRDGRLIEDYWEEDWASVASDFEEMKELGANVVRVHLQVGRFLKSPEEAEAKSLARLKKLLVLAERVGLYLDLTGLGCYHADDVPEWYDTLEEEARWEAQSTFWEAIAKACAESPAVFCYDLMNEPILPGKDKPEESWLAGDFGGKHFVQRIALDLKGRTKEQVARAWIEKLTSAIRKHDAERLITIGVIPWALVFPGAKPLFHGKGVGDALDFVSVHFYPNAGEVEKAVEALRVYDLGKPLVVEETFPLKCSPQELESFIEQSSEISDGWIGFYWGETIVELEKKNDIGASLMRQWLELFKRLGPARSKGADR
ncbi:MAG: cellulase family glycosylhydrolase [Planctomycetota bacterium]